jgi:hypothetical protein
VRNFLILAVLAYRLIPAPVRRIWSFGCSTSYLALAELRSGAPLSVFWPHLVPLTGDSEHFQVRPRGWR